MMGTGRRSNRSRTLLAVATIALTAATPAITRAQSPAASSPAIVEVLGLQRWTVTMLRDSLRRFRPDAELGDAACMALLRDSLHFLDASVTDMTQMESAASPKVQHFMVIKVVEPGSTFGARWRSIPATPSQHVSSPYREVIAALTDSASGAVWPSSVVGALSLCRARTVSESRG